MQTFKTSKAKENILSRIRKSLSKDSLPIPFPNAEKESLNNLYTESGLSPEETFADNFIKLGGKFVFCNNEQELLEHVYNLYDSRGWQQLFCAEPRLLQIFRNNKLNIVEDIDIAQTKADGCITGCEVLSARTGSVILSSKQYMGRTSSVFYPVHIIVAYSNQVAEDIQQGLNFLKQKYGNDLPSMINLNTGPSRTADIEKTLVVGVHGPGEVFCFFVNA